VQKSIKSLVRGQLMKKKMLHYKANLLQINSKEPNQEINHKIKSKNVVNNHHYII
jgi:hypothetical protein